MIRLAIAKLIYGHVELVLYGRLLLKLKLLSVQKGWPWNWYFQVMLLGLPKLIMTIQSMSSEKTCIGLHQPVPFSSDLYHVKFIVHTPTYLQEKMHVIDVFGQEENCRYGLEKKIKLKKVYSSYKINLIIRNYYYQLSISHQNYRSWKCFSWWLVHINGGP